ncbi:carboxypeptidase-like regulatory domain-containing protein [Aquimarina longa]|uniref:carboxypeptidase-like regulatory domain-containing protein n=1 Tax=Aquimarina longa TaxID=1080221 RepID=UPI00078331EA|nr:carboxypeptidase-like regulatory domain-containing protein [Aquimarina longa]
MIKTTISIDDSFSSLLKRKQIALYIIAMLMFPSLGIYARDYDNSISSVIKETEMIIESENVNNTFSSYLKCVTFKNIGDCDTDIYQYSRRGCRLKKRLAPGESWILNTYRGTRFRAVEADATDFSDLEFNVLYRVNYKHTQVVNLDPQYCIDPCESLIVDAGEDVKVCNEEEVVLTASVTGTTTCTTPSETDCNHSLYCSGGYYSRYYPHSNAAYCGNGKGAKLWTASGYGTSYVTIDFGKEVPKGTKIHTRMKLKHCSNTYANLSSAKISASKNGNFGFVTLGTAEFSSTEYAEYTYTLEESARYIQVVDNGKCSFLVDYVKYEIEGTTDDTITYSWSGPGIVGATDQESITVNEAGTYTVSVTNCDNCTVTDTVKVKYKKSPTVEVTHTDATCEADNGTIKFTFPDNTSRIKISLSIDGGENYTTVADDSGSYTFEGLAPGSYDISVRWGNKDCPIDLETVIIDQTETISVDAGQDQAICSGQEIILSAQVDGEGKCTDCIEYNLKDTDYCRGDHNFVVWIKDGNSRRWFKNVDLVWKENTDGTATLKGTVFEYAVSNTEFEVDAVYSGRTVIAPKDSPKEHFCHSESTSGWVYYTELTGTITQVGGSISYDIQRRGPAFQLGTGANNYETATAVNGGSGWFNIVGDYQSYGDFNFNLGECITSTTTGVEYLWSTGETTESITVSPTTDTEYTVTVSNCGDCTAEDTVNVTITNITVDAGDNQTIIAGETATLTAVSSDSEATFTWSTGETTETIYVNPSETTTYTVTATNSNGCVSTDTVTVEVVDPCIKDEYNVVAYPIPVEAKGILNIDVAVNKAQSITYATYKMDGNRIGPEVTYNAALGCNTIAVDLSIHCSFLPATKYVLVVTGDGWTKSIHIQTKM